MLYVGHDTTIIPFLSAFGVFDGNWPPYAATVTIELYSSSSSSISGDDDKRPSRDANTSTATPPPPRSPREYVQLYYNEKPVLLRDYPTPAVPLEVFVRMGSQFVPQNYLEECVAK